MAAYSLMMAGTSLMVLIAGIIGLEFAPTPGLATLPVAFVIVGVATATLPTGKLLNRWGRRKVFLAYGVLATGAAALSSGWVLFQWGWPAVLWACVPLVLVFSILLWKGTAFRHLPGQ